MQSATLVVLRREWLKLKQRFKLGWLAFRNPVFISLLMKVGIDTIRKPTGPDLEDLELLEHALGTVGPQSENQPDQTQSGKRSETDLWRDYRQEFGSSRGPGSSTTHQLDGMGGAILGPGGMVGQGPTPPLPEVRKRKGRKKKSVGSEGDHPDESKRGENPSGENPGGIPQ